MSKDSITSVVDIVAASLSCSEDALLSAKYSRSAQKSTAVRTMNDTS